MLPEQVNKLPTERKDTAVHLNDRVPTHRPTYSFAPVNTEIKKDETSPVTPPAIVPNTSSSQDNKNAAAADRASSAASQAIQLLQAKNAQLTQELKATEE